MKLLPPSHRELAERTEIAVLTTIGPDGFPQSTAVGILLDGDVFRVSAVSNFQKVKNLRARPECTLFLIDTSDAYRTVEVRGRAEILDDSDFQWGAKVAESNRMTEQDVRDRTPEGTSRVCIMIEPTKINAFG